MKKLVIGILAHVDAGKTTLSEELLYLCGEIRKIGRVDHGDAFLDTYELEKERGITIFSKQALLKTENMEVTLLDTPGHVDFSAEMERTSAGPRLCDSGDQWNGRCAESYDDFVEASGAIPDSDVFVCQ